MSSWVILSSRVYIPWLCDDEGVCTHPQKNCSSGKETCSSAFDTCQSSMHSGDTSLYGTAEACAVPGERESDVHVEKTVFSLTLTPSTSTSKPVSWIWAQRACSSTPATIRTPQQSPCIISIYLSFPSLAYIFTHWLNISFFTRFI